MPVYTVQSESLTAVANAIRSKGGTIADLEFPDGFVDAIGDIVTASGKNGQLQSKVARTSQTSYTDLGFEITVAKTGTYNVYWAGYRSSTSSGTNGAKIYVNGVERSNAFTTFDGTYANCQNGHIDNISLTAGDKVTIRGRARNTSSYFYVFNLAIIEQ